MVDLTQDEKNIILSELDSLQDVPNSDGVSILITQKESVDVINKKFWDESDYRIVNYETEKKNIMGDYPDSPVTESDIVDCANFSGRIYDYTSGNIYRHESFDGFPTIHTDTNELKHKDNIYNIFNELVNGFTAPANGLTTSVWSDGTGNSDTDLPSSRYLVGSAIIDVVGSIFNGTDYTITYTAIVPSVINSGETIGSFSGFSNTERINKIATLQDVMNYYLTELDNNLASSVTVITNEINAVSNNDDTELNPDILTDHSNHRAFINTYKTSLDISDTGIYNFKLVEDVRLSDIAIREAEINSRLFSLRDQRYNWSSARANSSEGSLTLQKRLIASKAVIDAKAQAMTDQKNFYESNMDLT